MSTDNAKSKRGFANMTPERIKEVAAMGGKESQRSGKGHKFDSQTGKAAGSKENPVQEQDDYADADAHIEAIQALVTEQVILLTEAVLARKSDDAREWRERICECVKYVADSVDETDQPTRTDIHLLTIRFYDKNDRDTLLTISPIGGIRAYKKHGLYMAKVFLGEDHEITAEGFSINDLKDDLADQLFEWWRHFENNGWDNSPVANDLRKWFQFTATAIPGEIQ